MAITKQKKEEIFSRVADAAKESECVVFANFHGLNVADTTELRKDLREKGIGYYVAKKTIVRKALKESPIKGEIPELSGELAIAYSDDPLSPAQEVYAFQKKFKDRFSILGGVFEGTYRDATEMTEIALIPPKDVLRGMFVNVINSPIQGFVVALDRIAEKKAA